ncbi:MAG: MFS transporter [candidate division Zixibacteria bacterium]|nr:MFS transporter [candidate division Zixibacteria bacterium]
MPKFPFMWIFVTISFVNLAVAYGLYFSFSIFFVAILEEFKWSRASIAGAFSVSSLLLGISSWFIGRLVDRFGPRKILIWGAIILSFAIIASGSIREVWHLYLFFGVLAAIGTSGLGWVPHSVLLSNWFFKNRGAMVGIAFSGMGIGILIIGPVAQYLISGFGWRTTYMFLGLMILVSLLPLNCILRNWPSEKESHLKYYHSEPNTKVLDQTHRLQKNGNMGEDWTLGRSMKTLPFWSLCFSFFLIPLGIFPVVIHQVAYVIDQGYSKELASFIFGLMGFMSTIGRLIFGIMSDRIGREKAVTLSFICSITGILILLFLPLLKSVFCLYLYSILFGVGFGARGPIITAMMADMYQGKHFGSIYGFINIGNGIGGALGPWLGGYLHDVTGSYQIPFIICIPVLILACILFWIAGWSRGGKHETV